MKFDIAEIVSLSNTIKKFSKKNFGEHLKKYSPVDFKNNSKYNEEMNKWQIERKKLLEKALSDQGITEIRSDSSLCHDYIFYGLGDMDEIIRKMVKSDLIYGYYEREFLLENINKIKNKIRKEKGFVVKPDYHDLINNMLEKQLFGEKTYEEMLPLLLEKKKAKQ